MAIKTQFSTDPNAIVTVNVSIVQAPTPNTYQRSGALVSFGGSTLQPGDTKLLTQLSDLTSPPATALTATAASWAAGVVTVTTATSVIDPIGTVVTMNLSGFTPVGYNGQFQCTMTGANQFTYALAADPGAATILGEASYLSMIQPPIAISTATWAAGTVTATTTSPIPGVTIGDQVDLILSGFTPSSYNGRHACTFTATNAFSYSLAVNPGVASIVGHATWATSIELQQMATTYFGQGNEIGVWVLELGYQGTPTNAVGALDTWLTNNPLTIYNFLMPRMFGSAAVLGSAANPTAFTNLLKRYQYPEAMEYFFVTVTPSTMGNLDATYKDVFQLVEAPELTATTGVNLNDPDGEFTLAAVLYNSLQYRASNTNRISPMAFKYLYGVTQYPQKGNGPLLKSFKASHTNYVSTGAEGGISFTMLYEGVTLDGKDYFNWWYTIDWVQIEVNLELSNAIINGSNNPLAPLYYNQEGINYLETVLYGVMQHAQTFGMVLGKIVMTQYDGPDLTAAIFGGQFAGQCNVNAVPFLNYTLANPGDYKIGEYDGLSTLFIPARGFIHILVNVVASDLVSI